jgi:hypothetical protein
MTHRARFIVVAASFLAVVILGTAVALPSSAARAATPTATPMAVPDAASLRDDLLKLGMGDLASIASPTFEGFFPAWHAKYPALEGDGYGIESTPGTVSVWYNHLDPKGKSSALNPDAIVFAVKDAAGRCAAGAIYGYPKIDSSKAFTITGKCAAGNAAEQLSALLAASATPTTTTTLTATASATAVATTPTAPRPPATGTGTTAASPDVSLLLALAAVLLTAGLAGAALLGGRSR